MGLGYPNPNPNFGLLYKDPNVVPKLLDFYCGLAWQLIENANFPTDEVVNDVEVSIDSRNSHNFATDPHHTRYFNDQTLILGAK